MEDISEVDAVGLGCSLERFNEWQEVYDIIDNLEPNDGQHEAKIANYEKDYYRFRFIVDQYKEQPHLLDPYLEEIVSKIIKIATASDVSDDKMHQAFKYFRLVTNVRGFKLILQYLPHAAADMEPVVALLEKQNSADNETWETRYSLLLWLCIIVKIPFHLSRLDDTDIDPSKTITQRLVNICHQYLMVGDKCRDICAYLCSQFFTRADVKESMLPGFLTWLTERISDRESGWKRFGPLYAVAAILKHGKRLDLLPYAGKILKTVMSMDWKKEPYRLARLFAVKIIQRVGLTYLKARVVSWRYKRGARVLPSISEMVSGTATVAQPVDDDAQSDTSEVDDQEVPQELDDIVEELTQGLRDEDITVRWSAAKGIGRVMARMNKQFGDEVIGCVLDLLTPRENAFAWHGGCLALAEFSKQGLLLPARLPEIVPLVKRALVYDEPMSVGSHIIRDAACYVAWTFARAYDPDVFQPYVADIAPSLVIVFCLDREINMRRAAAAAFQEHIGRQGTFPHGIEILTTADYFSVGVRINAYLNITTEIAKFEEYRRPIIDHLVERKTVHWDVAIRDLTAKALHNLTEFDSDYMVGTVLPSLLNNVNSIDANARHGSIIAIGEIVHALHLKKGLVLDESITRPICSIVSGFKAKLLFKGISGELMKVACCHLIDKCSQAEFPVTSPSVIGDWQDLLSDCLCHEVNNIRTAAAAALPSLFSNYYIIDGVRNEEKCSAVIKDFISKLSANDGTLRVGHALALGSLPLFMMTGFVDVIVSSLIECSKLTPETSKWVESRRYAIKALTSLFCTVGIADPEPKNSCRAHVTAILDCMIVGMLDYTKDDRGDTGAWVRESSMTGLQTLLLRIAKEEPSLLTEKIVRTAVCLIVQQAVERIARTRALAGTVFSSILHSNPEVPSIEHRENLRKIFPQRECLHEINWLKDTDTFPRFVQLLSLSGYKRSVLLGLIAAVGGLTESLVKTASSCLFDYLRHQDRSSLEEFCSIVLSLYKEHISDDRVVLSMLSFLDRLLSSGAVTPVLCDPSSDFASEIFNLTRTAVGSSTDKFKLTGSVDIYCQLIQVNGSVRNKSLGRIQILLCHRFGWLRKLVATKLYEALMLYEDDIIPDEAQLESALSILSDVEWSTIGVEEARSFRNKLSDILGIPTPKLVTAKQ
ncbi:beta-tubulin cofactor D [Nesidiocoris tenuis]|uniref:Tubulin-specific chaperone D n=1 Tax=Nesidiocoris tenuis TaxID=355587 RepID=A0ABN7AV21_9HEMI|nr:beta-tubulin cofactor D [Nesidiocoris tenuis]